MKSSVWKRMASERRLDGHLVRGALLVSLVVGETLFGAVIAARPKDTRLILGAVLGFVVGLIALMAPVLGLYLLVAEMFAGNLLSLGTISAGVILFVVVCGVWAIHGLVSGRLEIVFPAQAWLAIAFATWGGLSVLWGIAADKHLGALRTLVHMIGVYFLTVNLANSFGKVKAIMTVMVVAGLGLASLALFHVATGEVGAGRADVVEVFGSGPHDLAGYLLPAAAVLMVLFSRKGRLVHKLLSVLGLLVIVLAILFTGTRAAVVSLVVVALVGAIVDRQLLRAVLPMGLVAWGTLVLLPASSLERFQSILTLSDRGAGRLDIWLVAVSIISHYPILGVGLDNFGRAFDKHLADTRGLRLTHAVQGWGSHNTFLNIQAELGLIGSVLFAAIVGMSVVRGWVAIRGLATAPDRSLRDLALAAWLGLLGILVMCVFLDWQYAEYLWLLLGLVELSYRLFRESRGNLRVEQCAC